jgi:hypothetical protein
VLFSADGHCFLQFTSLLQNSLHIDRTNVHCSTPSLVAPVGDLPALQTEHAPDRAVAREVA